MVPRNSASGAVRLWNRSRDTSQTGILPFDHEARDGIEPVPVTAVEGDQIIAKFVPANATDADTSDQRLAG